MGLLSYLKRFTDPTAEATAAAAPDAVAAARTRARQRLIGATVLLGVGVVGFPLLFETQPRPIPVNIPIEIPRKDGVAPLVLAPASAALTPAPGALVAGESPLPAPLDRPQDRLAEPGAAPSTEWVERPGEQGREVTAAAASRAAPVLASASGVAARPALPASRPAVAKPAADEGARAQALLDGQAASAAAARLVVQVGAYSDADKLREARQRLEKLGLKTYTQVVEVDGAKRTRVRVGPFASRVEADQVAARIKAAGLPVAVLAL